MAKEVNANLTLSYIVGTQIQSDITRISLSLKAREARLVLKDMYEQKMISTAEYETRLKEVAKMVGIG